MPSILPSSPSCRLEPLAAGQGDPARGYAIAAVLLVYDATGARSRTVLDSHAGQRLTVGPIGEGSSLAETAQLVGRRVGAAARVSDVDAVFMSVGTVGKWLNSEDVLAHETADEQESAVALRAVLMRGVQAAVAAAVPGEGTWRRAAQSVTTLGAEASQASPGQHCHSTLSFISESCCHCCQFWSK